MTYNLKNPNDCIEALSDALSNGGQFGFLYELSKVVQAQLHILIKADPVNLSLTAPEYDYIFDPKNNYYITPGEKESTMTVITPSKTQIQAPQEPLQSNPVEGYRVPPPRAQGAPKQADLCTYYLQHNPVDGMFYAYVLEYPDHEIFAMSMFDAFRGAYLNMKEELDNG